MGRARQIENHMDQKSATYWGDKPWGMDKRSHKFLKDLQHRRERRRAKKDPECSAEYRKYDGYDW